MYLLLKLNISFVRVLFLISNISGTEELFFPSLKMLTFNIDPKVSKEKFYQELEGQVKAIISGQRNWVTNLANVSSLIYFGLNALESFKEKPVNWAGFYILDKDSNTLILGPFQGKIACTQIKVGKGVCGTGALTGLPQVVPNVHKFPGHIACDSASKSEIVIPLFLPQNDDGETQKKQVIGVLDIDDSEEDAFTDEDRIGLEAVSRILVQACDWPF